MVEQPLDYFEPEDPDSKRSPESKLFQFLYKANVFTFPVIVLITGCVFNLKVDEGFWGKLMSLFLFYLFWTAIVATVVFIVVWLLTIILTALKIISSSTEDIEYQLALFLSNIAFVVYIFVEMYTYQ